MKLLGKLEKEQESREEEHQPCEGCYLAASAHRAQGALIRIHRQGPLLKEDSAMVKQKVAHRVDKEKHAGTKDDDECCPRPRVLPGVIAHLPK